MGTKSSKISNVADEMAATGGKNSGSVIDKLTEAQLDEFREAFNSFDKVPSQHAATRQRAQETFCMGTTASGGAQKTRNSLAVSILSLYGKKTSSTNPPFLSFCRIIAFVALWLVVKRRMIA